jgi:hypothetical protein
MKTANLRKKTHSPVPVKPGPIFLLFPLLLFAISCTQDPIFYYISQEPELRNPRIQGTPTNIVEFDGGVYVANFTALYRYSKKGTDQAPGWDSVPRPDGQIWGLAATDDHLYILTDNGLSRLGKDAGPNGWSRVGPEDSAYTGVQKIYADSKRLFAGVFTGGDTSENTNYAILYDDGGVLKVLKKDVHLLSGAAFDETTHFISTRGSGIFTVSEAAFSSSPVNIGEPMAAAEGADKIITGIIYVEDTAKTIAAITRDGKILTYDSSSSKFTVKKDIENKTTGALALWRQPPSPDDLFSDKNDFAYPDNTFPRLLLAGVQNSTSSTTQTYNNGYREIVLDGTTGSLPNGDISVNSPGNGSPTSITNNEKYTSSLGQLPINYMFQVPYNIDPNMTFFASTQLDGLWTYRDHDNDGNIHWNAE